MDEGLFKRNSNALKELNAKKKSPADWTNNKKNSDLEEVSQKQNTIKEGTKKVFEKRVSPQKNVKNERKSILSAGKSSSASSKMSLSPSPDKRLPIALLPLKTDGCFNIESGVVKELFINNVDNDSNTERSSHLEYLQNRISPQANPSKIIKVPLAE